MLVQFSITNYKNFKDSAVLDLTEGKISEHSHHLIKNAYDRLGILPVAMIYGPNGSGKSNFLKALWHLRSLVLEGSSSFQEDYFFHFDSQCKKSPVEYEVIFRVEDREYDYQLKMTASEVIEENLFARNIKDSNYDVIFDRDSEGVFLCPALEDLNVSRLTDREPLLYFLSLSKKQQTLLPVYDFFRNMIFLSGHQTRQELISSVLKTKSLKEDLLSILQKMDASLTDIKSSSTGFVFTHTHQGKALQLSWNSESSGIRQLLAVTCCLLEAGQKNALILADTPELYLHPIVLDQLYHLYTDQKELRGNAQLLAVTQENSTMNNGIFRRDELWILAPGHDGASSLYPLSLYLKKGGEKVRKDETYSKQYLEGRYGGIPVIKK